MQQSLEQMGVGFYVSVLKKLMAQGIFAKEMSVLVIAGGDRDRAVLQEIGFTSVTISNVDSRLKGDEFAPYTWSFQDAENLTYADSSFDLVIVHAGLHHCHSPHRGMLEMHRVASRAALIFEARDSLFLKAATRFGISEDYELSAVKAHDYSFGGVGNSAIPNYIYRWTEREVKKTIQSFAPQTRHRFQFFYGVRAPHNMRGQSRTLKGIVAGGLMWMVQAATRVFPTLGNEFGILIFKADPFDQLQPWLAVEASQIVMKR